MLPEWTAPDEIRGTCEMNENRRGKKKLNMGDAPGSVS